MLLVFLLLCLLVASISRSLLLVLLLLEMLGFVVIFFIATYLGLYSLSDYLVLAGFTIFVMEGAMALCGLILLVSFAGSDYLISSSLLKV